MLGDWSENRVSINGIDIRYIRGGDPSKPALVLAHGLSDQGPCWLPAARELEAEYDLVLPDARGHGRSARVRPGQELDLAADLAALIRALGLARPIVGGHSMGADTAAQLGARFPESARALVLEDPPWREPAPVHAQDSPPVSMIDKLIALKTLGKAEMKNKCRNDHPGWPEAELDPWVESKLLFDPAFKHVARVPRWDWPELVAKFEVPALLITADPAKGAIVTPAMARKAAALNPRLRVEYIDGAGHNIRRENFNAYIDALKRFLQEI